MSAAAPLSVSSWMLQVKGIPVGSTNADTQANFSRAISTFHGSPFRFAYLHIDPAKPVLGVANQPQQALLHFDTLEGACKAQSCLWETAEHYKTEWAWLKDAKTHILERRVQIKQPDEASQLSMPPVKQPFSNVLQSAQATTISDASLLQAAQLTQQSVAQQYKPAAMPSVNSAPASPQQVNLTAQRSTHEWKTDSVDLVRKVVASLPCAPSAQPLSSGPSQPVAIAPILAANPPSHSEPFPLPEETRTSAKPKASLPVNFSIVKKGDAISLPAADNIFLAVSAAAPLPARIPAKFSDAVHDVHSSASASGQKLQKHADLNLMSNLSQAVDLAGKEVNNNQIQSAIPVLSSESFQGKLLNEVSMDDKRPPPPASTAGHTEATAAIDADGAHASTQDNEQAQFYRHADARARAKPSVLNAQPKSKGGADTQKRHAAEVLVKQLSLPSAQLKEPERRQKDRAEVDRDKYNGSSHDSSRHSSRDGSRERDHSSHKEPARHRSSHRPDSSTHQHHHRSLSSHHDRSKHSLPDLRAEHSYHGSKHAHLNGHPPSSRGPSSTTARHADGHDQKRWHAPSHSHRKHLDRPDRRRSRSPHRQCSKR